MNMLRMLALAAVAATFLTSVGRTEDLKLAITDVEGLERLQTEWGPFKEQIEKASGISFEFFPVNSRTAAAEALKAKRVDVVISGPAEYVVINKVTSAEAVIALSRPDYFCALVVRADSGINSVADLKGKKVAMNDIGSTSGHLCPSQLLADNGVDPQKDLEGVVHVSLNVAHEALKRGDVAAIGVNHNTWIGRARSSDTSVPPGYFRVLARSGDLPNDLLMVGAHLDQALVKKLRDAMIGNKSAIAESIVSVGGENEKFRGMDIVAVNDAAYDGVRRMYVAIGQPQFSDAAGN
jgi:phosphonate transport system substrate-binding protein